jgi:hypothetical protein
VAAELERTWGRKQLDYLVNSLAVTSGRATAELVEILPQHAREPLPVSLVHPHGRQVPRHVRVVMSWMAQLLAPHLE